MRRLFALFLFAVCVSGLPIDGYAASFFQNAVPLWPIDSVGDAISDSTIAAWRAFGDTCRIPGTAHYFPAKGHTQGADVENGKQLPPDVAFEKKLDPEFNCNDGDMTMFNALLCASGERAGCAAVKAAQAANGRFFRSPHRKWMWSNRCFDTANPPQRPTFVGRCANGFSPDMNLGVLLYTLATRDVAGYRKWLGWLDGNAKTTELCKLDDKQNPYDCLKVEWPRVCDHDLGFTEDPPAIPLPEGRRGGECVMRPWDALDFAAVNDALAVKMPGAMNTFEVTSRVLMKSTLNGVGSLIPGVPLPLGEVPPLLLLAFLEPNSARSYPLHLDDIRVLIRMMIRNPSMKLNNLPDLPEPDDFIDFVTQIGSNDGTDPATIALAAKAISRRAPWNPFYRLLSDGPTNDVRSLIMERCPVPGSDDMKKLVSGDRNEWIWEVFPDRANAKNSMGWDCVFIAQLYNKMRVKKAILDELLDWALKMGDAIGTSLKVADRALQVAQAGNALAHKALDQAERDLNNATTFVTTGYGEAKKAALDKVAQLQDQVTSLNKRLVDLSQSQGELAIQLASLPEQLEDTVEKTVCPDWVPPWANPACEVVKETRKIANPEFERVKKQLQSVNEQIADIQKHGLDDANAAVREAEQAVSELDQQLIELQQKLASGVLDQAVKVADAQMDLADRLLSKTRDRVVELRRADQQLQNYIKTWTGKGEQDAQVINVSDGDLETARPTPEEAQSTLCLPGALDTTADGSLGLTPAVASLFGGNSLGEPISPEDGDSKTVFEIPKTFSLQLQARASQLTPCPDQPLSLTVYYRDQRVFALKLERQTGAPGAAFGADAANFCGTETLQYPFEQFATDPRFAKTLRRFSATHLSSSLVGDDSEILAYTDKVATVGGTSICTESLTLSSTLTPSS